MHSSARSTETPLSTRTHVALGYVWGATLLTVPHVLGGSRRARALFALFGALAVAVNALTDTPLGVRRVVPLRAHRAIDVATDPFDALLPLTTGIVREPRARALWPAGAAVLAGSVAPTDWDAPPER